MTKNYKFLFFLILIIALFFRLYNLASIPPGLYPDEAMNGNNAREALETKNFKIFYPENNGREGLFINIQALFLSLISKNEPWVLRLPSAIFGFLTVLGLYFLILELFLKVKNYKFENDDLNENDFAKKIALFGMFILATSFWHINFSRIGFRAIMAPFLSVWAFYFLLKALNQNKKIYLYSVLGGIFFGLGFYTYIAYRIMPLLLVPLFYFYFKNYKQNNSLKNFYKIWICFLLLTFFVALPIGIYFLKNTADFFGRTTQISIFNSGHLLRDLTFNIVKTLGMFNFVGDFNWRHNFSGKPELDPIIGVLFLFGIYVSIKLRKNENFKLINSFVWTWFLLAMLPVIISNEGLPHALRAILMLPPVIILSALGGIILYEKIIHRPQIWNTPKQKIIKNLSLIMLFIVLINTYVNYFILWANNPNTRDAFSSNYVELGKKLNSLPQEVKKYVVVEASGVLVRGIPMPAQTVMFITDTFLPEKQMQKNIFYILPDKEIPQDGLIFYLN